jgi:hypothetical protein
MRGLRAVTISRALAAPSGKDTDARNLIVEEPQGPGERARLSLVEFYFYSIRLGCRRVRPPPPHPSKKPPSCGRIHFPTPPRGRVLVHPRACALPGTQKLPRQVREGGTGVPPVKETGLETSPMKSPALRPHGRDDHAPLFQVLPRPSCVRRPHRFSLEVSPLPWLHLSELYRFPSRKPVAAPFGSSSMCFPGTARCLGCVGPNFRRAAPSQGRPTSFSSWMCCFLPIADRFWSSGI